MATAKLFTADVARALGVSDTAVGKIEKRGELRAERVGSRRVRLFDEAQVAALAGRRESRKRDQVVTKAIKRGSLGETARELFARTEGQAAVVRDRELTAARADEDPPRRRRGTK